MPNVAVCICTHNPDQTDLARAIRSIGDQEHPPSEVVLIDNASEPALAEESLAPLRCKGIPSRLVIEPRLGLSYARLCGIHETAAEWLLFVDDDNELFSDYIREGLSFIARNPSVGCFGGRLYLPSAIQPPHWTKSYLPWLGIKDGGDQEILNDSVDSWGVWEPPGAGSWVHRDVLNEYVRGANEDRRGLQLGRCGRNGLASCDDSLLMRGAYRVRRANAYVPSLKLNHHIAQRRFELVYLLKLMKAYGESHVLLDVVLKGRPPDYGYPSRKRAFAKWLFKHFRRERRQHGWRYAAGQAVYHWSLRRSFAASSNRVRV